MNDSLTDISIVLDRSGSMEVVRADTIGGFNAFISEQKAVPGAATVTLVQFDTEYETVFDASPLRDVPNLTEKTFVPRGGTALLDAIGRTINSAGARLAAMAESQRPGKVLLVIMTDGEENSSREFSAQQVNKMITHQREVYSWQVVFIGANQDAIATGASIGIPAANSLNYAHTGEGTQAAIRAMSASAASYRRRSGASTDNFFAPEQEESSPEPKED